MRKKLLKKWLNNLRQRGVPMIYDKQRTVPEPKKKETKEQLAHMRRDLSYIGENTNR